MKRSILDTFSNKQSHIDPAFKSALRSRLLVAEKRAGRPAKQRSHARKLWLVPAGGLALGLVLLAVGFGFTYHQPTKSNNPFQLKAVSAAEVIKQSDTAESHTQLQNYTYFRFAETISYGPAANTCDVGNYVGNKDSSYITSGYRAPDAKIEAALLVSKPTDGTVGSSISVYDDSAKQLFDEKEFVSSSIYRSLTDYFAGQDLDNNVVRFLSDKQGNRMNPNQPVATTTVNGKQAYVVYAVSNPASQEAMVRCWPAGSNRDPKSSVGTYIAPTSESTISQIILDANNFTLIRDTEYRHSITPDNLLKNDDNNITFLSIPANKALILMAQDGFDKAHAIDTLPAGD